MGIQFLFHAEENGRLANDWDLVEQYESMFGWPIDGIGPGENCKWKTFEEAKTDPLFDGYTWVYFDQRGKTLHSRLEHPADNVVYVAGHDSRGWAPYGLPNDGITVKLDVVKDREYHGMPVIVMAAVDRQAKVGRMDALQRAVPAGYAGRNHGVGRGTVGSRLTTSGT
jgi:hypothetical protein